MIASQVTRAARTLNIQPVSALCVARTLYESTAAELATGSVEHVSYEIAPSTAAEWLATNGYDAAPVGRDGDPVGFIHEDDVGTEDTGDTPEAALTPLTIDYMISGDTSFAESLAALIEEPVYFLGGHNRITGILTRADLNTPPARMYLFDRVTYLENTCESSFRRRSPTGSRPR